MSIEYAEQKVLEALKKADGNKAKANNLLMRWVYEDHQLLVGMTGLHLKGIIPYWINRMEQKQSIAKEAEKRVAEENRQKEEAQPEGEPKTFGEAMLRSFAGQVTAEFGLESGSLPLSRRGASDRHRDAISKLARPSKKKD